MHSHTSSETNNQNSEFEFINNLVMFLSGYSLEEIPEEQRERVIQECLDKYKNFILDYFKNSFSKVDYYRLKNSLEDESKIFNLLMEHPDMKDKLEEAFQVFLDTPVNFDD